MIYVYRGSDEITLMEELLHFEVQQRYLKGQKWDQAKFVSESLNGQRDNGRISRIGMNAWLKQNF